MPSKTYTPKKTTTSNSVMRWKLRFSPAHQEAKRAVSLNVSDLHEIVTSINLFGKDKEHLTFCCDATPGNVRRLEAALQGAEVTSAEAKWVQTSRGPMPGSRNGYYKKTTHNCCRIRRGQATELLEHVLTSMS